MSTTCSAAQNIACNDDGVNCNGYTSRTPAVVLTAGTPYYVIIGGCVRIGRLWVLTAKASSHHSLINPNTRTPKPTPPPNTHTHTAGAQERRWAPAPSPSVAPSRLQPLPWPPAGRLPGACESHRRAYPVLHHCITTPSFRCLPLCALSHHSRICRSPTSPTRRPTLRLT